MALNESTERQVTRETYEKRVHQEVLANIGSFEHFTKHLRIATFEGPIISFALNDVQKLLLQIREDIRARKLLNRVIILKARREGVSTFLEALFFWRTSTSLIHVYVWVVTGNNSTDRIENYPVAR